MQPGGRPRVAWGESANPRYSAPYKPGSPEGGPGPDDHEPIHKKRRGRCAAPAIDPSRGIEVVRIGRAGNVGRLTWDASASPGRRPGVFSRRNLTGRRGRPCLLIRIGEREGSYAWWAERLGISPEAMRWRLARYHEDLAFLIEEADDEVGRQAAEEMALLRLTAPRGVRSTG